MTLSQFSIFVIEIDCFIRDMNITQIRQICQYLKVLIQQKTVSLTICPDIFC